VLVKLATTRVYRSFWAVARALINALSQVFVDGQALRTIVTRRTPARAKAGPPATRPAAACAGADLAQPARWAIRRR
jgi:2-methylcitrate dehydratase PrpD